MPTTTLTMGAAARIKLQVFDLQGRLVRTLLQEERGPGRHTVKWNGRDGRGQVVSAGVYLARLSDGWRTRTQNMVLLK